MWQFIARVLIFSGLLLFVLKGIKTTVPFYWGNEMMHEKMKYVFETGDYNTFFIGGSTMFYHIDPHIFDEKTNAKSYNLGCPGTFYLETHYLLEYFIRTYSFKEKTRFFMQMMVPTSINDVNMHSIRSKYFLDFKRAKIAIFFFLKLKAFKEAYKYFVSFIENQLCIGEIRAIIKYHIKGYDDYHVYGYEDLDKLIVDKKGFTACDEQFGRAHSEVFAQTTVFKKNKQLPETKKEVSIRRVNPAVFNISTSGKLVQLFRLNKTQLEPEYLFDGRHFNAKGVKIYNEKLIQEYLTSNKTNKSRKRKKRR